jgi:4-hydroxymandelate oxidase
MDPINLFDFEALAKNKLESMIYDYYAGGAEDEITVHENQDAYHRIRLKYRVLIDVSHRDLSTTVLGQTVSFPVLIAPTAFQRMAHRDGEVATARAAGAAGTIMILSTLSNSAIEEVVAAGCPTWFQLYIYKDRSVTASLVQRAKTAGCKAIVLTVDAPVLGRRERDIRNRFELPSHLSVMNLLPAGLQELPQSASGSGLAAYIESVLDPAMTWKDVDWLCSITDLPVLIKGMIHPADALRALEHGVSGIVVSNHGGRQLDTAAPTIEVLSEIVDTIAGKIDVLIDGGIRRGTDVLKAIAVGAKAVLIGRPILWGLAVNGEQGVAKVLSLLRNEFDVAMALCGCTRVDEIQRSLIF